MFKRCPAAAGSAVSRAAPHPFRHGPEWQGSVVSLLGNIGDEGAQVSKAAPPSLSLGCASRNNRLDDRGVERLVVVQADGRIELGARLHLVDHGVRPAVAGYGGV